jgi:hypothetical protein
MGSVSEAYRVVLAKQALYKIVDPKSQGQNLVGSSQVADTILLTFIFSMTQVL